MNQEQNNQFQQDNNLNNVDGLNQQKKSNGKVIIIVVLVIALIIGLGAFFLTKNNEPKNTNNNSNNNQEEKTNNKEKSKYKLIEYKDPDFGYTMKSLDENQNEIGHNSDGGSDFWTIRDGNYDDSVLIFYSEYDEQLSDFSNNSNIPTNSEEIIPFFSKYIEKLLSHKTLHTHDLESKTFSYENIKINGLDAVKFKDTIKCDNEKDVRDYGFSGVAVLGEKRSYVFFAVDYTEDMSMSDEAINIIMDSLVDFKEEN